MKMNKEFKKNDVVVVHDHVCMNPDCVEGVIGLVLGYAPCGCKDRVSVQIYKNGCKVTYHLGIIEKIGKL